MKILEYLRRHSFPLPKPEHGLRIGEHFSTQLSREPLLLLSIRDKIFQTREDGFWTQKPQQTLELILSTTPSQSFCSRFFDFLGEKHRDHKDLILEAAAQIDGWIIELLEAGARADNSANNEKIISVFGRDTPLFLIGSVLGRSRLMTDFYGVKERHLVDYLAHCAQFEDILSINKAWPFVDEKTKEVASRLIWTNLPMPLDISFFPDPDPPLDWWHNGLIGNPIAGNGRSNLMTLIAKRPHLMEHFQRAQMEFGHKEIAEASLFFFGEGETFIIETILRGWVKKIGTRLPTYGNLADLYQRLYAAGDAIDRLPNTPLGLAWARLIDCIQSLCPEVEGHGVPFPPQLSHKPSFPTATSSFNEIWKDISGRKLSNTETSFLLDLGRMAILGETQREADTDSLHSYIRYSSKLNTILRFVFSSPQCFSMDRKFTDVSLRRAERMLRPEWPSKSPEITRMDLSMRSIYMETSLWKLMVSRIPNTRSLGTAKPLTNKEKGFVRNIMKVDQTGARLVLPALLAQAFEISLREDEKIPDWLISLLQQSALNGGQAQTSGGQRRL